MANLIRRRSSSIKKEFTEKELEELKTAFGLLDRNQDGQVTAGELKIMLNNLGIHIKDDKVEYIVRSISHTGSTLIDENDFLNFIRLLQKSTPELDEDLSRDLSAAFKVFDLDGDGYITREELKIAMEMIGEPVTESQLTLVIQMADTDHDNKINYEEFVKLLTS